MAAILCSSLASLCKGLGECLSIPCRLCGVACNGCCEATGRLLTSPFSPYLITTVALNAPPFVWGVRAILESNGLLERCEGDTWLWINALLCLGHVLAAFYIVYRIQQDLDQHPPSNGGDAEQGAATSTPATASTTKASSNYQTMHDDSRNKSSMYTVLSSMMSSSQTKGSTSQAEDDAFLRNRYENGDAYSWQRLQQVLCYDMVVAVYIIGAIFWLIWQSVGVSQAIQNDGGPGNENLCDSIQRWNGFSIMCGFIYCMLVCVAFSCSLLCLRS